MIRQRDHWSWDNCFTQKVVSRLDYVSFRWKVCIGHCAAREEVWIELDSQLKLIILNYLNQLGGKIMGLESSWSSLKTVLAADVFQNRFFSTAVSTNKQISVCFLFLQILIIHMVKDFARLASVQTLWKYAYNYFLPYTSLFCCEQLCTVCHINIHFIQHCSDSCVKNVFTIIYFLQYISWAYYLLF